MRTVLAWAIVIVAMIGGYYLSAAMILPLIQLFAAHTSPTAASVITVIRVILMFIIFWLALKLAIRVTRR